VLCGAGLVHMGICKVTQAKGGSGCELWGRVQDVWKAILTESGRMDRHIDCLECSKEAREFLRALLQRDPSKRVSASQALQLPVCSLHLSVSSLVRLHLK
jgi:serine/threonine protein kinase